MMDPAMAYGMNCRPQLASAMVAAAALTMPRDEGTLRGLSATQGTEATVAVGSAGERTTADDTSAVMTGAGGTKMIENVLQQMAIQASIAAAT